MRTCVSRVAAAALVLLLPALASAQTGTIAGEVKDTSGAVLPGVTVEVTSPALIEKTRTAVTDGAGRYSVIQLPPGLYGMIFTLPGFSTVKRDGIQLETDFTATVNAELKVGAVEETITVSAESPIVDVQSTATRTVMTREVLDTIPTGRNIQAVGIMIPGTALSLGGGGALSRDVGGSGGLQQSPLNFRGSADTVQAVEGMRLNNLCANGAYSGVYWNDGSFQEISYVTGADSAEMGQAGLRINMVPKDGGNSFRSTTVFKYSDGPWQADNLRSNLAGDLTYNPNNRLTNVSKIQEIYDINPTIGGPIVRDKMWFNFSWRRNGVEKTVADSFFDADPSPFRYVADPNRPGIDDGYIVSNATRVTWQISEKDKFAAYHDQQGKVRKHWGISALVSPEASAVQRVPYSFAHTSKWTRTQTNRLLLEAGFAIYSQEYIEDYQPEVLAGADIATAKVYAIQEQNNNRWFSAWNAPSDHYSTLRTYSGSASYVTGSHSLKIGAAMSEGPRRTIDRYTGDLTMQFTSGVPTAVVLRLPRDQREGIKRDLGIFVQDRWTIQRATLNLGVRYDNFVGAVLDQELPPSRWTGPNCLLPNCSTEILRTEGFEVQDWKDISPRFSFAYDLFGTGRTALKTSIGRFLQGEAVGTAAANNPQVTISRTDTRNWTDLDNNLSIFNNDGSLQLNELGPSGNANFGRAVVGNATFDPRILNGWFVRRYSWEWAASLQQEIAPRVSANVNYYFRWDGNRTDSENTLVDNTSYDGPFCIDIPDNDVLPGAGQPECGLFDLKPAFRGLSQTHTTFADDLGGRRDEVHGIDVTMQARFAGAFLQGGINMQRTLSDTCATEVDNPENRHRRIGNAPEGRFCNQVTPFRPDFKLLGSYTFPGQIVASGTYQFVRGPAWAATWSARSDSVIRPGLGRNLAACPVAVIAGGTCTSTKSIGLIEPNTVYGENLNQLDLRLSKRFQFGRFRVRGDVDLYNVFNSNWPFTLNGTFSTAPTSNWLRPTNVLQGRLFQVGGQLDF